MRNCILRHCKKTALYNYKSRHAPTHCEHHRKPAMVKIRFNLCTFNKCNYKAVYNYKNVSEAEFCIRHKRKGMVNVLTKKCKMIFCENAATFNYPSDKESIYCEKHKIHLIYKCCQYPTCEELPYYNYKYNPRAYCKKHKNDEMIFIEDDNLCLSQCNPPYYNFLYETHGKFCHTHKQSDMVVKPTQYITQPINPSTLQNYSKMFDIFYHADRLICSIPK